MPPPLRKKLYALQQRAALTAPEASALLVTSALLLVGLAVRHVEAGREPSPSAALAALDAELSRRAALSVEEARASAAPAAHAHAPPAGEASPPDEGEGARAEAAAGERADGPSPRPASRLGPIRVNVNTAPARTLERLPGIGPALAARVVEHREQHGPFRRAEDLAAVRGIGPKTVEKLAPYVAVD